MMIKTKNQITLIAKMYKMYRLKRAQKNLNMNLNKCHDPSHTMSTLCPQVFVDLSAPEVVSH